MELSACSELTAERHLSAAVLEEKAQLHSLERFAAENAALTQMVQELPLKVAHEVMVPFGRAAFFPGRLLHTNEFTVLLGEGLYALRSAVQTAEILDRRAVFLDTKMAALLARLQDLQAKAAFAGGGAHETEEGVVEIKEEYEEGMAWARQAVDRARQASAAAPCKSDGGEEDAEILARLEELEMAEAAQERRVQERSGGASSGIQGERGEGARTLIDVLDERLQSREGAEGGEGQGGSREGQQAKGGRKVHFEAEAVEGEHLRPSAPAAQWLPSTVQQRAFPGAIVEHAAVVGPVHLAPHPREGVADTSAEEACARPVSRFKQRLGSGR